MRRRASSMMVVVMVLAALALMLFAMAQMATFHLQFSTALEGRQQAQDLAESAVQEALAQILADDRYGVSATPTLLVPGYTPDSYGIASFSTAETRVPVSKNALTSTSSQPGSTGLVIPASCVHLVGRGKVGSLESTVETLYYRPPFPRALSATGPILATDTVVVGLPPGAVYPGSPASIPAGNQAPGSLQSNSPRQSSPPAVKLVRSRVSGNAAAVGQVEVDATSVVGGEVRSGGAPQAVPPIDVRARIATVDTVQGTEVLAGPIGSHQVDWFSGSTGPLTINGDLTLNNGVLWVRGDLTVTGGIKGQGLVLCDGNVKVQRGSDLSAQNMVALAATGNVELHGPDRTRYYFQGLVYCNGNFVADNLTVLGTVLADSPNDPTRGGLTLDNVNLVSQPTAPVVLGQMYVTMTNPRSGTTNYPSPAPTGESFVFTVHVRPESPMFDPRRRAVWCTGALVDLTVANVTVNPPRVQTFLNLPFNVALGSHQAQEVVRRQSWSGSLSGRRLVNQVDAVFMNPVDGPPLQALTLLPSLNNLMAPSERSRILLWRSL